MGPPPGTPDPEALSPKVTLAVARCSLIDDRATLVKSVVIER